MKGPDGQLLLDPLTGRELEVLRLLADGLSNHEIAQELVITHETVKWYNKQIYSKLDVHSRKQAVAQARGLGLFDTQPDAPEYVAIAPKHNLPIQMASFVGREREIAEVQQLLRAVRLLTLTGPGGTGKTRLALQAATDLLDKFQNGIFFVDLAPISQPELVADSIASTLSIQEVAGQPISDTLKHFLENKKLLLLLDNFEHVIGAAPLVMDLLSVAPGLRILITSREVLRVYGEQEYLVPPLSLPDLNSPESVPALSQYEAVALFIQRAQAVKTDFSITEADAPSVAEICVRLDGLPLAIELAAAQVKLFSPQALLGQLESRFIALRGGPRGLPARQRTLHGAIEWSYELLDEAEKTLFARLSVFQGGCTIEAVEAVCSHDLPIDVLDGLESLLNKSLLRQADSTEGDPRFAMLETIHEYAREQLEESGEVPEFQRRHAEFFTEWVEQSEEYLFGGPDQLLWLRRLEAEHDNLRTALAWSLGGGDRELGQRLAGAMNWFWYRQGHHREWGEWLERANVAVEGAPLPVRAKFTWCAAMFAVMRQENQRAIDLFREAIRLFQEVGDKLRAGYAQIYMSNTIAVEPQRRAEVMAKLEEVVATMREIDNKAGLAQALNVMGNIDYAAGNFEQAQDTYEALLDLAIEIGDTLREALTYSNLSRTAVKVGEIEKAERFEKEAVSLGQEIGYKYAVMSSLHQLAQIEEAKEVYDRAARLAGAFVAAQEELGILEQTHMQPLFEALVAAIREQLGEETFKRCWADGLAMSFNDAMAYALDEPGPGQ